MALSLLRWQTSVPSPAISPYLSLAQIETFTIKAENTQFCNYYPHRLPDNRPIPVTRLELAPDAVAPPDPERREAPFARKIESNRTELIRKFDPGEFVVRHPDPNGTEEPIFALRLDRGDSLFWPRLRQVTYVGCYLVVATELEDDVVVPYTTRCTGGFSVTLDFSAEPDTAREVELMWALQPRTDSDEGFLVRPRSVEVILGSVESKWWNKKLQTVLSPQEYGKVSMVVPTPSAWSVDPTALCLTYSLGLWADFLSHLTFQTELQTSPPLPPAPPVA